MLEDMQAEEHDDVVDEYEFVIASLLSLSKITSDDITPIMKKFRAMAGPDFVISIEDMERKDNLADAGVDREENLVDGEPEDEVLPTYD